MKHPPRTPWRRARPPQVSPLVGKHVRRALARLRQSARLYLTLARELDGRPA